MARRPASGTRAVQQIVWRKVERFQLWRKPANNAAASQQAQDILPVVVPDTAAELIESTTSTKASGFSLANLGEIKGYIDRLGGIDGILTTVTKVQKVMSSVSQMAPLVKVLMGSFGKKSKESDDDDSDEWKPKRRKRRKPRAGSGSGKKTVRRRRTTPKKR